MMERYRAGEAVPLSEIYDYWAACLLCVAAGVWITLQLPAVLAPSTISGVLILVLVSAAGGAAAVVILLVAVFYSVTTPYCQRSAQPVAASAALHAPGTPATADSICSKGHTRQSADSFSTLGPHLCRKGRYSGQLWTVPGSAWCDTDVLHEFPPPISGPAAVATCWQASCRHGCLELVANAAAAQSAGARKVRVSPDGCVVSVVTECIPPGKSVWWKKAPLLISHSTQPLGPYGQQCFYIFAEHAAAKEQWLLALQWNTAARVKQLQQTCNVYEAFCRQIRGAISRKLSSSTDTGTLRLSRRQLLRSSRSGAASSSDGHSRSYRRLRTSQHSFKGLGPSKASTVVGQHKQAQTSLQDSSNERTQQHQEAVNQHHGIVEQQHSGSSADLPSARPPQQEEAAHSSQEQETDTPVASTPQLDEQLPPGQKNCPADASCNLSGVNVLMARIAFELLNSNTAEGRLGGMLQKWLDNIRRPAYLDRAKLVDLDLGCCVPIITGFKAASCPGTGAAAAPMVQTDIVYEGAMTLYIETSVDLHNYAMNMNQCNDNSSHHSRHSSPRRPSAPPNSSSPAAKTLGHSSSFVSQPAAGQRVPHHQRNPSSPPALSFPGSYSVPDAKEQQLLAAAHSTCDQGSSPAIQRQAGPAHLPAPGRGVHDRMGANDSSVNEDAEDETDNAMHAAVASTLRCEQSGGGAQPALPGGSSSGRLNSMNSPSKAGRKLLNMLHLRKATEQALMKAIGNVPARLMHIPIQLVVEVTKLDGTLVMWIPPPPSSKLWLSFSTPPKVELSVKPVIAGRTLHYPVLSNRVSRWLEGRLLRSLGSSMVFPAAADVSMPWFTGSTSAQSSGYSDTAIRSSQQQQRGQHQQNVGPLTAGIGYRRSSASGGSRFTATGLTASKLQQRMAAAAAAAMREPGEDDTNSSDSSDEAAPFPGTAVPAAPTQQGPRTGTAVGTAGPLVASPNCRIDLNAIGTTGSASVAGAQDTADMPSPKTACSPVTSQSPVPGLRQRKQQLMQHQCASAASLASDTLEQAPVSGSMTFATSVPRKVEPMSSLIGPLAPRMPLEREGSLALKSFDVSSCQSQAAASSSFVGSFGTQGKQCHAQQHKQGGVQLTGNDGTGNQPAVHSSMALQDFPRPLHAVVEGSQSSGSSLWLLQQPQTCESASQRSVSCSLEGNSQCLDNTTDSQSGAHRYASTSSDTDELETGDRREGGVLNEGRNKSFVGKLFGKMQRRKKKKGSAQHRVLQEVFELRAHSADDADMRKSVQGSRLRQSYRGQPQLHAMRYTDTAADDRYSADPAAGLHEQSSTVAASQLSSEEGSAVQWQLTCPQTTAQGNLQQSFQVLGYTSDPEQGYTAAATESLPDNSDFSFNSSLHSSPVSMHADAARHQFSVDAALATPYNPLGLQGVSGQQQISKHTAVIPQSAQQRSVTDTMLTALATGRSHSSSPAKLLMQRIESKTLGVLGQQKVSSFEAHGQQGEPGNNMLLKAFQGKVRQKVDGVKERMGDMAHKVGSMTDRVGDTMDNMRGRVSSLLVRSNSSIQRSNSMPPRCHKQQENPLTQQQKQRHQNKPAVSKAAMFDYSRSTVASSCAAASTPCSSSSGCTTSEGSSEYTKSSTCSSDEQRQQPQTSAVGLEYLQPDAIVSTHTAQRQVDECKRQHGGTRSLSQAVYGRGTDFSLAKVQDWQEQRQTFCRDNIVTSASLQNMAVGVSAVSTEPSIRLCVDPGVPAATGVYEAAGQPSLKSWHEVVGRTSSSTDSER